MTNNKLPDYFKEYLDERFDHVLQEIKGVKDDVESLKKNIVGIKAGIIKVWAVIGVLLMIILVHFGESSETLLGRFLGFL